MESLENIFDIHDSLNVVHAENLFTATTENDEREDAQSASESQCRDGVCVLTWRPKRPEAAA